LIGPLLFAAAILTQRLPSVLAEGPAAPPAEASAQPAGPGDNGNGNAGAAAPLDYTIELTRARQGFDRSRDKFCWAQARAGVIPPRVANHNAGKPGALITLQQLWLKGSDVYSGLFQMDYDPASGNWTDPRPCPNLAKHEHGDGVSVSLCDFTPKWHATTGRLLGTGHTAWYRGKHLMPNRPREVGYSVYDAQHNTWSQWQTLELPERPEFENAGAGCTQRVDLPGGDVLLPIYFKRRGTRQLSATVVRCRFDGRKLTYVEHGDVLTVPVRRGFAEPSLTRFDGRYYLTLRNDEHGYVTSGPDGLRFEEPKKWTFDDGKLLGSYNTQQHWATHSDGLFLVYTRRGADNDHVFRHRAPLFIGRVDPQRLCVMRDTERIVVPERGTRIGNFGVVDYSPEETWVTTCEWMQPAGVERYGSDNSVYVAKIRWNRPNRCVPWK
jgi:hypothetical protein